LDDYIIKKEKLHEVSKGWIHRVDLYKDEKQLTSITFNDPMEIDGKYFDIVEGPPLPASLDNFLESVYPDLKANELK